MVSCRSVRLPSDVPSCHLKHLGERNCREDRPGGSERIASARWAVLPGRWKLYLLARTRRNLSSCLNISQKCKYNWIVKTPVFRKAQTPRPFWSADPICWSLKKWRKLGVSDGFVPSSVETFQWYCILSCFFLVKRTVDLGHITSGSHLCSLLGKSSWTCQETSLRCLICEMDCC